ncbi:ThuA domain-containing protein [Paludisphaera mucosa]|uniref:ThuA domain-containing protein n=1 Tax=Paludisphaera mucosa TaxID=3030827 RepID=A0ABT6FBG9_9BACT|nr:ThuA domain-containing protein [Paludisphaera mucosa]MDG3004938.1 ThuA domain-containing protein [Paludisphaera mucosa]
MSMSRAMGWKAAVAVAAIGTAFGVSTRSAGAAEKLKVLIVEGQNNHAWKATTPLLKAELEKSGRFAATVATTPPSKAPASAWESFRPAFKSYDVVLTNYNGDPWPAPIRKELEEFVAGGGGLVVMHAANNAFADWPAYNEMIGLGWRDPGFGDRITIDDAGQVVRTPKGQGPGSGHGPRHAYTVVVRKADHPIVKGLPHEWTHATDELYHGQRGPAKDMEVLASAYSDKAKGGTGTNEPMLWTVPFGKGRVVTNVMGHTAGDDLVAIESPDFRALIVRSAEWAATGAVTLPPPADFPTAAK